MRARDPEDRPDLPDFEPRKQPSPWRRRVRRLFLLCLLLVAACVVAGWWALRTDAGRRWTLDHLSQRIEVASGWRVVVHDFDIQEFHLSGATRLAVQGVEVGAPGQSPLVAADRVTAELSWRSWLARPIVLDRAIIEGLEVDTGATLPSSPNPSDTSAGHGTLPLVVSSLRIDDATVQGTVAEGWLESWRVRDLALDGSVADGGFDARIERGAARIERRSAAGTTLEPLDLRLTGSVRGPFVGPYTVDDFAADGDGLALAGSGTLGLGAAEPLTADFTLDAEAGKLLGVVATEAAGPAAESGTLNAQGSFDFHTLRGRLEARARNLPAVLFEPWIGAAALDRAAARDTLLDVDATAELDLGEGVLAPGRVRGEADVVWRSGSETLVDASLRTQDAAANTDVEPPIRLAFAAELLPGLAGARHVEAALTAPSWSELARLRSDATSVRLDVPDLAALRRHLAERWPAMLETLPPLPWRGSLELRADATGRLDDPSLRADGTWRPDSASRLVLKATGRPLSSRGTVTLVGRDFDLGSLRSVLGVEQLAGRLDGRVDLDLRQSLQGRVQAVFDLTADDVALRSLPVTDGDTAPDFAADSLRLEGNAEAPWSRVPRLADLSADLRLAAVEARGAAGPQLVRLDADARLEAGHLRLRSAEGALRGPQAESGSPPMPFRVAGSLYGVADMPWNELLLESLDLRLTVDTPHRAVDRAELDVRLQQGVLGFDLLSLDLSEGGPAVEELRAYLPLADLGRVPGLEDVMAALPLAERGEGPLRLVFEIPGLDTGGLYRWLALEPPAEQLRASVSGSLEVVPDDPTRSRGNLVASDVEIQLAEYTFRSAEPQRITLGGQRLSLERGLWNARNRTFDAEATVDLEPSWRFGHDLGDLVESFSAVATGSLEAALLNGYLAGGRAAGLAEVTVLAAGTADDVAADIEVVGDEETSFSWVTPYATQLVAPKVRLRVEDGVVEITEANARFNEGTLDVEGTVLDADGNSDLRGFLDRVRYRVDYGLTLLVSGNFDLHLDPDEPAELSANLLVERGFLRRQLDPDRELISILLQPPDLDVGDASAATRNLRLDLDVATVEGVRVKNNVADFHASWAPLEVGGTLAAPFVRGSVEADPGGKIYAWGQVVRLDRAVLEFSGQPDVPARLDLTTTSSLEDPSIATQNDLRLVAEMAEPVPFGSSAAEQRRFDSQAITSGLTTYYGDQLASRLGASLSGPRLEYRPLWIFGESSPEAKLVVSQDLSSNVGLAVAFGLREADERIYLLDFHGFDFLPSLSATAFTDETDDYGATVQQQLQFGGGEDENEDDLPRLDDIVIRCPECTSESGDKVVPLGRLRRAVGFRPDDLIPEGSEFDIEVDVSERLRTLGFPDPEVDVDVEPDADRGYVDIVLDIRLGPRVTFEFAGEEPPRNRRDSIRTLYRVDYYEETSIEEMRTQTERIWKSLGHPHPEIGIDAQLLHPDDPHSDRRVIVTSEPGDAVSLDELRFEGADESPIPAHAALALAYRFDSQVWRVKLAAGDDDARERLLRTLVAEGFPRAAVDSVEVSEDGEALTVRLALGSQRTLESMRIVGLEGDELERARRRLELKSGSPFVSSQVAEAAAALELDLRSRGFYEAKVHSEIAFAEEPGLGADVQLVAEAGNRYVLQEIEMRGADDTDDSWLREISGLEIGAPLDRRKVAEARRKLVETKLFNRVTVEADHSPDGTRLVFDLVERPRFALAYGGRWESEGGSGAIFEALDRNFDGRGVDLGLRLLYGEQEQRARFYGRVPRVFGDVTELQLFAEWFDHVEDDLQERGWEFTGQLSRKLTSKLEARAYGRYVDQDVIDLTADDPEPEPERSPLVGVQLVWDSRDRLLDPSRGLLASFDLSGARDFIARDAEYERLFLQLNLFQRLGRERPATSRDPSRPWVWSQSLRLGLAETDDLLPRSVRFFAGGPFSVRGYADRSLGPQESAADGSPRARGGNALLVLNQELRFPLPWEGFQGVLFADAGNVWREPENLSFDDLAMSVGLGLRTETPIGIVRLDLGFPLDRRKEEDLFDDEYQVYFGFGHAF